VFKNGGILLANAIFNDLHPTSTPQTVQLGRLNSILPPILTEFAAVLGCFSPLAGVRQQYPTVILGLNLLLQKSPI